MRLAHISDLHLGSAGFVPEWGDRLHKMVNSLAPDVLIVTGDLTDEGLHHEYEQVRHYLQGFETKPRVIVPGNHDARYNGVSNFEDYFGDRCPTFTSGEVVIAGLDSSVSDHNAGRVGWAQYDSIRQRLSGHDGAVKILALHHHLLPIPGSGRERDIVEDAGDMLQLCTEIGVHLVLCGHLHRPWMWNLEQTCFIAAGTATTNRYKARTGPSFYCIDLCGTPMLTEFDVRHQTADSQPIEIAGLAALRCFRASSRNGITPTGVAASYA